MDPARGAVVIVVLLVVVVGAVFVLRQRATGRGARAMPFVLGVLVIAAVVGLARGGGNAGTANRQPNVDIVQPLEATRVASPLTVAVEAQDLGAAHLHVLVDTPCLGRGSLIPTDDTHRHLAAGELTTKLDVQPGVHTICVQPGDAADHAVEGGDSVTVEVTAR
jgi:hypothetical protein